MDTQTRPRPALPPVFTEYRNLEGYPRTAFSVAWSPDTPYSSPSSPRPVQNLHYHSDPRGEPALRRHARAMVESLDPRRPRESITPEPLPQNLASIAEHRSPALTRTMWPASQASFSQTRRTSGLPTPRHLSQVPRRGTIVDETRSLLLTGLPSEHLRSIGRAVTNAERRRSLPNSPLTARRRNSHAVREQLLVWGHVYYGNALSADCFVVAVALRRSSDAVPGGDKGQSKNTDVDKQSNMDKVTIRARVRPRDLERKPFILQRTFNLDEIRSTIPEPPPMPASAATISGRRKSAELLSPSAALTPRTGDFRRRASSASDRSQEGRDGEAESLSRTLIRGANALPMHLTYARVSLPVLAALMVSGHIRKGDVIDLPMPHPEVWPQTVAYVYTGQVELTEPMKENILYLGGKVV